MKRTVMWFMGWLALVVVLYGWLFVEAIAGAAVGVATGIALLALAGLVTHFIQRYRPQWLPEDPDTEDPELAEYFDQYKEARKARKKRK